jgi:hypothetical protein
MTDYYFAHVLVAYSLSMTNMKYKLNFQVNFLADQADLGKSSSQLTAPLYRSKPQNYLNLPSTLG